MKVIVCGPSTRAIGGGPTHIKNIFACGLSNQFDLHHLQMGSRGRESPAHREAIHAKAVRIALSPLIFALTIIVERPALVHINSSLNHKSFWRDLVLVLLAKSLRRPVVYQVHGGSLAQFCETSLMRGVSEMCFSMVDAVLVLSSVQQASFSRLRRLRRLCMVANAVDVRDFSTPARVHSGRVRRLSYLGRISREKGLFEAVEAVACLKDDPVLAHVEFLIAGSGPDEASLEQLIRGRAVGNRVRLIGAVDGRAKIELLRGTDVFLFPSYHEGLPYAVIEALAAGAPVIATNVGGIPDMISTGTHGVLIEPRDADQIVRAIRRLADASSDALQRMSNNCTRAAEQRFGLQRLAGELGEVYAAVIEGRRKFSWDDLIGVRSPAKRETKGAVRMTDDD